MAKKSRILKLEEIIDGFRPFRVKSDDIKEEILKLYQIRYTEFGHIINIWNDEEISGLKSLKNETKLEINFRGMRLIKNVAISFTFINRLLFDHRVYEYYGNEFPEKEYYEIHNYLTHLKNNVIFFCDIAKLHTIELIRISKKLNEKYEKEWYRDT